MKLTSRAELLSKAAIFLRLGFKKERIKNDNNGKDSVIKANPVVVKNASGLLDITY